MATPTTCPSCGHQMGLPGSVVGPVACPKCGKTFEVAPAPSTARSSATRPAVAPAPGGSSSVMSARPVPKAVVRPPGSPPELLERIPRPFILTPPGIAAGGVFVLFYGLVMIPVLSAYKNRPESVAIVTTPGSVAPIGPAMVVEPPKDAKPNNDASAKPNPEKKDAAAPKPDEPKKDKDKPKDSGAKPGSPKPEKAADVPKNAMARVEPPKVPRLVAPALAPKPEAWGDLRGFPGDCKFESEGAALKVVVPGTLHTLSADPRFNNSPRLMTETGGDFIAAVQVVGTISPGIIPLDFPMQGAKPKEKEPVLKFPFTFQGAGLLLVQDDKNYIRLERTAKFIIEAGKRVPLVLFELYHDGNLVATKEVFHKETDVLSLKIEKTGGVMKLSYSPDLGKNWIDVKRLEGVVFPPQVKVGISASNVSAKPFEPRFQNFELAAKKK